VSDVEEFRALGKSETDAVKDYEEINGCFNQPTGDVIYIDGT
jgi:hypothetical protein